MIVAEADNEPKQTPFRGRRILVIEDEYFLAEDICSVLRSMGADIIGPTGELNEAVEIVNSGQLIDAAVLDVNLRDVSIFPVADSLRMRKVPFVFTTGYDRSAIDSRFGDVQLWEKPIDLAAMVQSLGKLIGKAGPNVAG